MLGLQGLIALSEPIKPHDKGNKRVGPYILQSELTVQCQANAIKVQMIHPVTSVVEGRPGAVVRDLDVSEASVSDQLYSSCAQTLGEGDEGLQLGQYLCWYHGSIHCCCCQLTLQ